MTMIMTRSVPLLFGMQALILVLILALVVDQCEAKLIRGESLLEDGVKGRGLKEEKHIDCDEDVGAKGCSSTSATSTDSTGTQVSLRQETIPTPEPTRAPIFLLQPTPTPVGDGPTPAPFDFPAFFSQHSFPPFFVPTGTPTPVQSPPPTNFPFIIPTGAPTLAPFLVPTNTKLPTALAPLTVPTPSPITTSTAPVPAPFSMPTPVLPVPSTTNAPTVAPIPITSNAPQTSAPVPALPTPAPTTAPAFDRQTIIDGIFTPTRSPTTGGNPTVITVPTDVPVAPTNPPTPTPTNPPSPSPTIPNQTPPPTPLPTNPPSPSPTVQPIPDQTPPPTPLPTNPPTPLPTNPPTPLPSPSPTIQPVPDQTAPPTPQPTPIPTNPPTPSPTQPPTPTPTNPPTPFPTQPPTPTPTNPPSPFPTQQPVPAPTNPPTPFPTQPPTPFPTNPPSPFPTQQPVPAPTNPPTPLPSPFPTPPPSPFPTFSAVRQLLEPLLLQPGAFDRPSSYQAQALDYLENRLSTPKTNAQYISYFGLACIYYASNAVPNDITDAAGIDATNIRWITSTGWVSNDIDQCSWYGIECDAFGRVSALKLDNNRLFGIFAPEVQYLAASLTELELFNNPFLTTLDNGPQGNEWIQEMTQLEFFYIGTTGFQFSGVPPYFGLLPKILEIDISRTRYTNGPIPPEVFSNNPTLAYIDLGENVYTSPIPSTISSHPGLDSVYVDNCIFDNGVQQTLDFAVGMPQLFELWMDFTPLSGGIPPGWGAISSLTSVSLTFCSLSGPLPTELGQLSLMYRLWLYQNQFSGTIPTELGNLNRMELLLLEGNKFVGSVPEEICADRDLNLGQLEELGADCDVGNLFFVTCSCCTCCGSLECNDFIS